MRPSIRGDSIMEVEKFLTKSHFLKKKYTIVLCNNYYLNHMRYQIANEYDCVSDGLIPF